MYHAVNLYLTSNDGVQFAVLSLCGEVASILGQGRRIGLAFLFLTVAHVGTEDMDCCLALLWLFIEGQLALWQRVWLGIKTFDALIIYAMLLLQVHGGVIDAVA